MCSYRCQSFLAFCKSKFIPMRGDFQSWFNVARKSYACIGFLFFSMATGTTSTPFFLWTSCLHSQDKQYTNTGRIKAQVIVKLFKYINKHDVCTFSIVSSMVYGICKSTNVFLETWRTCSGPCVCCFTDSLSCDSHLPSNKMHSVSTAWRCSIHFLL